MGTVFIQPEKPKAIDIIFQFFTIQRKDCRGGCQLFSDPQSKSKDIKRSQFREGEIQQDTKKEFSSFRSTGKGAQSVLNLYPQ